LRSSKCLILTDRKRFSVARVAGRKLQSACISVVPPVDKEVLCTAEALQNHWILAEASHLDPEAPICDETGTRVP
jgi:hypothetical protein